MINNIYIYTKQNQMDTWHQLGFIYFRRHLIQLLIKESYPWDKSGWTNHQIVNYFSVWITRRLDDFGRYLSEIFIAKYVKAGRRDRDAPITIINHLGLVVRTLYPAYAIKKETRPPTPA